MKKIFSSKELQNIFITVLILGFCFSFRWKGTFSISNWINSFVSSMLVVGIIIISKLVFQKYVAKRLECNVTYDLWLSGIVISLISTVISLGYFVWAAPGTIAISTKNKFRIGKEKDKIHAGPQDFSLIAISGVLIYFVFAIIGKIFAGTSMFGDKLLLVGSYLAIFNLIPFVYPHNTVPPVIAKGNLPYLEGVWIFFGSRTLWAFSFSFVLISLLGFLFLGTASALIIALIGSIILWLLWQYYAEPWSYRLPNQQGWIHKYNKKPYKMGVGNKLKK